MYWIFGIKNDVVCAMMIRIFDGGVCHVEMGLVSYGCKSIVVGLVVRAGMLAQAGTLAPRDTIGAGTGGLGGTSAAGALVIAVLHAIGVRDGVIGSKRRQNSCSGVNAMVLGVVQVMRSETRMRLSRPSRG